MDEIRGPALPDQLQDSNPLEATHDPLEGDGTGPAVIPVVGIGASAGGLDVFKRLLSDLPVDTGFAIVFIQHLDPNHQSMLAEILARTTTMPVMEAADGIRLEANHVYVIPANIDLTIADGALKLAPRTQTQGLHLPIDRFLRSLADQLGSRAIGVILSGAGSDGSAGVEAIKGAGGVTFAQDASTARFATMPQAAVATGCVDFVLPPEAIATELARIGRHPYLHPAEALPGTHKKPPPADDEAQFADILDVLHRETGIDFSQYREQPVKRRILRRLALNRIDTLKQYSERLRNDTGELMALHKDLLISVTRFFRDLESFEALKTVVFPRLLEGRPAKDTIRIWVAGCSTGEEAFSIAISLQEYFSETNATFPVQIFGSDLIAAAIEKARTGRYPENIAADVSEERLNRFFTKIEGGYQVNKSLREMCVFARHNLIDDPPFSKLDLISCRNVLIYLGKVQKDILQLFHYALKPNGFLLLGSSETGAPEALFSVADREHRIYSKRQAAKKPKLFHALGSRRGTVAGSTPQASARRPSGDGADVRKEVDLILLSRYSPSGVLVNEDLEVIEILGKASPYLALPAGKVSFHLAKLIPDTGLFLEVEKLIRQVRTTGEPARREHVDCDRDSSDLNLEAVPLDAGQTTTVLVIFEEVPRGGEIATSPLGTPPEASSEERQIARLKQQLAYARQRLIDALEENQSSMEESQNTTEEALSANEELQSLNEELETAKEELQSTNEELISVNDELQTRNRALAEARDLATSIVEAIRHPLVVLDMDLRIRTANKAFYQSFQVSPLEGEGQVFYSVSRGNWDLPALRNAMDGILRGDSSFPDFEVSQSFPGLGRRSLVFGGGRINHLNMILLAIDDITESKLAQQALRAGEERLRQSQKMESLGRLAGGIAHDFNNLLTVILGYSNLLRVSVVGNEPAAHHLLEIEIASEKAASLTQQLLSFSRRQVLHPEVLELNTIVADCDRMLRRLVGERITIALKCEPALWQVRVDAGEISRALINLSLNARDAMPGGGTLTIETANVTLTEAESPRQVLTPGKYAMIAVHDTGIGIDAETQTHIFEPFFTTKEIGKGTGLGLATVLGIVEQSGGAIRCESEPGRGTSFRIFLPAVAVTPARVATGAEGFLKAARAKGSEVILLVEDDEMVRALNRDILKMNGYIVNEAGNGQEGLAFCEAHEGPIDLLVSDVVMPGLGGREFAERALGLRPGLKVLFVSGHTEDIVLKEGVKTGTPFLQKPYTPAALAQKVRETLDSDTNASDTNASDTKASDANAPE
jgi:two-component system, chemotaxis family, CheB/CheR fusion protein